MGSKSRVKTWVSLPEESCWVLGSQGQLGVEEEAWGNAMVGRKEATQWRPRGQEVVGPCPRVQPWGVKVGEEVRGGMDRGSDRYVRGGVLSASVVAPCNTKTYVLYLHCSPEIIYII